MVIKIDKGSALRVMCEVDASVNEVAIQSLIVGMCIFEYIVIKA